MGGGVGGGAEAGGPGLPPGSALDPQRVLTGLQGFTFSALSPVRPELQWSPCFLLGPPVSPPPVLRCLFRERNDRRGPEAQGAGDPVPFIEFHPLFLLLWSSPQLSCRLCTRLGQGGQAMLAGSVASLESLAEAPPYYADTGGRHQPGCLGPAIPAPTGVQHSSHTSQ